MNWFKRFLKPDSEDPSGGSDKVTIKLREGTAEYEYFMAKTELEHGSDLKHGAGHIASLVSFDPFNREWIELLETYIARSKDPLSLAPMSNNMNYTVAAMRAYILNKQGQLPEAISLLTSVTHAKPDARYFEAWAIPWLEEVSAIESLPVPHAIGLFGVVAGRFPESKYSTYRDIDFIQRWSRLLERYILAHNAAPELQANEMLMLRCSLMRKGSLYEEAEALAREDLQRNPNWCAATALGLALRQQGDAGAAEEAFKQALTLDPQDNTVKLEAGDMYVDRGEWQKAQRWYQAALRSEPKHVWAFPSELYCRWKLHGKESEIEALVDLARQGNGRAGELAHREIFGNLDEPGDAIANLIRQIRAEYADRPGDISELEFGLSAIEAPSNFVAFRLEMDILKIKLETSMTVSSVQNPDPRKPVRPDTRWVLWKYDGVYASPALPPPSPEVSDAIAALAKLPFDPRANWAAASKVAVRLGASKVEEVLSTMVQPPAVPENQTSLSWLPRVQLAAAQVVAHIDEGWDGSLRKDALFSVLFGPQDWTTTAAIRALTGLANENESYALEIGEAFEELAKHRPDVGYCCWERPLYGNWIQLPHLFPEEREELDKKMQRIANEDES